MPFLNITICTNFFFQQKKANKTCFEGSIRDHLWILWFFTYKKEKGKQTKEYLTKQKKKGYIHTNDDGSSLSNWNTQTYFVFTFWNCSLFFSFTNCFLLRLRMTAHLSNWNSCHLTDNIKIIKCDLYCWFMGMREGKQNRIKLLVQRRWWNYSWTPFTSEAGSLCCCGWVGRGIHPPSTPQPPSHTHKHT